MEWLNYHHFFYFWSVAREGTRSEAAKQLHVARTDVTAQVRELEKSAVQEVRSVSGTHRTRPTGVLMC